MKALLLILAATLAIEVVPETMPELVSGLRQSDPELEILVKEVPTLETRAKVISAMGIPSQTKQRQMEEVNLDSQSVLQGLLQG